MDTPEKPKYASGLTRSPAVVGNAAYNSYSRVVALVEFSLDTLESMAEERGLLAQGLGVALRDVLPMARETMNATGELGSDFTCDYLKEKVLVDRAQAMLDRLDAHPLLHIRDVTAEDVDAAFEIKFAD